MIIELKTTLKTKTTLKAKKESLQRTSKMKLLYLDFPDGHKPNSLKKIALKRYGLIDKQLIGIC